MNPPIEKLREYVRQCDPREPLNGNDDARYVDLDDAREPLRGSDGSAIDQLRHTILLSTPDRPRCLLFTGYPGSGKTTELRELHRRLEAQTTDPAHVVRIDGLSYFDRYVPPSITDMLRVLAYHLDREAILAEGGDPEKADGYLKRLWRWLESDVAIKSIGFAQYGASVMFEIKDNPTFRQKAEAVLQLRFQEFAREAQDVIAEAISRLRTATGCARVVVLFDSLEQFTALKPEDQSGMEQSVEAVFVNHAAWLRLPCDVVYTFPLWLLFQTTSLSSLYDYAPVVLPMIKVRDRDRQTHAPGVKKMVEMVQKRIDDPASILGPQWDSRVAWMILASGGYPRDLLRMVRDVVQSTRAFPATDAQVERVIEHLAEEYARAALRADLDALVYVAREHGLPPGADALRAVGRLVNNWLVLTYRNGEEWYDVHPLVLRAPSVQRALAETTAG